MTTWSVVAELLTSAMDALLLIVVWTSLLYVLLLMFFLPQFPPVSAVHELLSRDCTSSCLRALLRIHIFFLSQNPTAASDNAWPLTYGMTGRWLSC